MFLREMIVEKVQQYRFWKSSRPLPLSREDFVRSRAVIKTFTKAKRKPRALKYKDQEYLEL